LCLGGFALDAQPGAEQKAPGRRVAHGGEDQRRGCRVVEAHQVGKVGVRGAAKRIGRGGAGVGGEAVQLNPAPGLQGRGVLVAELAVEVGDALDVAEIIAALAQQGGESRVQSADQPAPAEALVGADDRHLPCSQGLACVAQRPRDEAEPGDDLPGRILYIEPVLGPTCLGMIAHEGEGHRHQRRPVDRAMKCGQPIRISAIVKRV
jgi:hypothetical protein